MTEPAVLLDIADGVAQITLNHPKARNALSLQMREELGAVVAQVRDPVRKAACCWSTSPRGWRSR